MRRKLTVRITQSAERDLEGIVDHLAGVRGTDFALSYLADLRQRVDTLQEFPRRYRVRRNFGRGVRVLVERPYLIIYRVETDTVNIMRVLHGRRRITKRLIHS